jgi:hypothetical protein
MVGTICMPPPAVTASRIFPDEVHLRVGKLDEHLVRPGHVELRDVGKEQEADVEGHGGLAG